MSDGQWNIAGLLEARGSEDASARAMVFGDRCWTYGELTDEVRAFAGALEEAGVHPGDVVAISMANSPEMVVAFYGTWWLGAVATPLNSMLTEREVANVLEDSAARVVVTTSDVARRCHPERAIDGDLVLVVDGATDGIGRDLPVASRRVDVASVESDAPAVIMFTSGTTGRSKGAVLTHGAFHDANRTLGVALKGRPGPYAVVPGGPPNLIALPLAHVAGLNSMMFALYVGRPILLMERFRVEPFIEEVHRHGVHTFVATPSMLQMLAKHEGDVELPSLRFVHCTGAALPTSVKAQFERRFGVPIFQNYGQTETLHVAGWTRDDLASGSWKPGAVGRPYEGVEVRIADDLDHEVATGEAGEILVRSTYLMQKYVGQAAAHEYVLDDDGWLHTGDIGYLDDEGYLFLVDRKREVIITGGFNVYPAEVENALLEHPGVREVVVVGLPDERLGEVPHAFVVAARPGTITEDELVGHCRENIAHYKAVRGVTFVDGLPRTESQKIKRQQVKEMALAAANATNATD